MTLFDLIFLIAALALLVATASAMYLAVRRRWPAVSRLGWRTVAATVAYFAVLIAVSLTARPRLLPVGTSQCADEWCIAVTGATRETAIDTAKARGVFEIVTVEVTNQGRGRRQREADVYAYLVDADGRRFQVSPAGESALERSGAAGDSLTGFVDAGSRRESHLVFDVPPDDSGLALIKAAHRWTPARVVIGDPQSLLHPPTLMQVRTR